MAANQLDERDLAGVAVGGQIREDIMNRIFNISPIYTPFTMRIRQETSGSHYKEWLEETLTAANKDNARIDGSSSDGLNDTITGRRLGNYHQISTKTIRVSNRSRWIKGIESRDELLRQLILAGKTLRRDGEASLTSRNVAVAGDGSSVASKSAGIGAWIGTTASPTNTDRGATGADPILSGTTGGFPTTAATAGTKRALNEQGLKDLVREVFRKGGMPSMIMSTLDAIERISDYMLTADAKVASFRNNISNSNSTTNAAYGKGSGLTAQGAVTTIVTNFAKLDLVGNIFQPEIATDVADVYIIDPDYWALSFGQNYMTDTLAKTGLGENREISVDFTLCATSEEASAVFADVDTTLPMLDVAA